MSGEETCQHIWHAIAKEQVVSHYSTYSPDDEWLELDYSETVKLLKIKSVTCNECGEEAPPDVMERVKDQLKE